jgi:hypothetical protein
MYRIQHYCIYLTGIKTSAEGYNLQLIDELEA